MRCPVRFRGFLLVASLLVAASLQAACGSGESAEAGAVGTEGSNSPFLVTFSQTYVTIQNRTGVPIVAGDVQIIPRGVMPPFRTTLPRIEGSGKHDFPFNQFYSRDGTPFRRGITRTRTVRITASDVTGKKLEQVVEFE